MNQDIFDTSIFYWKVVLQCMELEVSKLKSLNIPELTKKTMFLVWSPVSFFGMFEWFSNTISYYFVYFKYFQSFIFYLTMFFPVRWFCEHALSNMWQCVLLLGIFFFITMSSLLICFCHHFRKCNVFFDFHFQLSFFKYKNKQLNTVQK
jgi:hypothetical protein